MSAVEPVDECRNALDRLEQLINGPLVSAAAGDGGIAALIALVDLAREANDVIEHDGSLPSSLCIAVVRMRRALRGGR